MTTEYMTVREAAAFLRLTVSGLRKIMRRKEIPYYNPFGGKCYFLPSDLLDYLQSTRRMTIREAEEAAMRYDTRRMAGETLRQSDNKNHHD